MELVFQSLMLCQKNLILKYLEMVKNMKLGLKMVDQTFKTNWKDKKTGTKITFCRQKNFFFSEFSSSILEKRLEN